MSSLATDEHFCESTLTTHSQYTIITFSFPERHGIVSLNRWPKETKALGTEDKHTDYFMENLCVQSKGIRRSEHNEIG